MQIQIHLLLFQVPLLILSLTRTAAAEKIVTQPVDQNVTQSRSPTRSEIKVTQINSGPEDGAKSNIIMNFNFIDARQYLLLMSGRKKPEQQESEAEENEWMMLDERPLTHCPHGVDPSKKGCLSRTPTDDDNELVTAFKSPATQLRLLRDQQQITGPDHHAISRNLSHKIFPRSSDHF